MSRTGLAWFSGREQEPGQDPQGLKKPVKVFCQPGFAFEKAQPCSVYPGCIFSFPPSVCSGCQAGNTPFQTPLHLVWTLGPALGLSKWGFLQSFLLALFSCSCLELGHGGWKPCSHLAVLKRKLQAEDVRAEKTEGTSILGEILEQNCTHPEHHLLSLYGVNRYIMDQYKCTFYLFKPLTADCRPDTWGSREEGRRVRRVQRRRAEEAVSGLWQESSGTYGLRP